MTPLLDALQEQRRGERRAHDRRPGTAYRRRRARASRCSRSRNPFPRPPRRRSGPPRRHAGDAGLLAQRFEIGVEDRQAAARGEDRRAAARTCPPGTTPAWRRRERRAIRIRVRSWPLPDERELREPHRIVSLPRPDEAGVAWRGVGANVDVVLRVGLERRAAEEREAREVARQRAPGDVFLVRGVGELDAAVHARASSGRCGSACRSEPWRSPRLPRSSDRTRRRSFGAGPPCRRT